MMGGPALGPVGGVLGVLGLTRSVTDHCVLKLICRPGPPGGPLLWCPDGLGTDVT